MDDILVYVIAIGLGILIGYFLVSKQKKAESKHVEILDWDTFKKNMRKGQLIDIRKEKQRNKGTIKGARAFSLGRLKNKHQTKVRKDLPVYLYCQNGRKSKKAARKLVSKGYEKVFVLKGGYEATRS